MQNPLPEIKCGPKSGLKESPLTWTHQSEVYMESRKALLKGSTQKKRDREATIPFFVLSQRTVSASIIGSAQAVPILPMAVLIS